MTVHEKIQEFLTAAEHSLTDESFVKISLGHYTGEEDQLKNIIIKKIIVKREEKLSFTYRYKTRDTVKNYDPATGLANVKQALGTGFHMATLMTTAHDMVFENQDGRKPALHKKPPSQTEAPSLDHDRSKKRLIAAAGKSWLHNLNITDEAGNVLKSAQDKYRQINKYVEILGSLIKDLPADRLNKIVDMGSGKGYLTFALYDYMTSVLSLKPQVTGVEYRADMVDLCNKIAKNAQFTGLGFVQGAIESYDASGVNILIALHACDTATDDAIYKGITAGAELIVVAPCCHKQIRREIESHKAHNDLDFLMKHGIFVERQAEMVTDGLRALILEYCGYTTKVFEFISDTHTPKNVLIVGTKNPKAQARNPAILTKIKDAKTYFGITQHHLEKMLGI